MARPRSPSLNGGMQAVAPAEDLAAAGPELLLEELHRSTVMLAAVGRRRAVLLRAARAAGVSRLELLEAARLTPGRGRRLGVPPCSGCGTVQAPRAQVRRRAVPDGRPV